MAAVFVVVIYVNKHVALADGLLSRKIDHLCLSTVECWSRPEFDAQFDVQNS